MKFQNIEKKVDGIVSLTPTQDRLLTMLKFFHSFCEVNGLRYYSIGGTALGSIRHNGFIPWDDDIDVGLPRKDYERLIELFGNSINGNYVLESVSSSNNDYCYSYAKLYDTTTTLIENTRIPFKRGVYIDIFPLDGAGDTENEVKKMYSAIDRKKKILALRTIKISKERKGYKNLVLRIVQIVPNFIFNERQLCKQIDILCKRKGFDDSAFVGNLNGAWGKKEIMQREVFGNPTLHRFETINIYVPENFDGYLTHIYGDWKKLPPKEKRISHHEYILDLSKPYIEKLH